MATVSHTFVSAIADDATAAAAGEVLPSHWNAAHTVSLVAADMKPAGTTGQIQYNNAGALGGSAATATSAGKLITPGGSTGGYHFNGVAALDAQLNASNAISGYTGYCVQVALGDASSLAPIRVSKVATNAVVLGSNFTADQIVAGSTSPAGMAAVNGANTAAVPWGCGKLHLFGLAGVAGNVGISRAATDRAEINNGTDGTLADLSYRNVVGQTGYTEMVEMTAPAAGAVNTVRLFIEDNGAGKTRLMAQFATGAAQQVAIQP